MREPRSLEIVDLQRRAVEVRRQLADVERVTYGQEWSTADLVSGLLTDVGDLAAAVRRVGASDPLYGRVPIDELRHELGDGRWVLLVLAARFEIDVVEAFDSTMGSIDRWLDGAAGD